MKIKLLTYLAGIFLILPVSLFSDEEDERERGGIEEIAVTAEKRT